MRLWVERNSILYGTLLRRSQPRMRLWIKRELRLQRPGRVKVSLAWSCELKGRRIWYCRNHYWSVKASFVRGCELKDQWIKGPGRQEEVSLAWSCELKDFGTVHVDRNFSVSLVRGCELKENGWWHLLGVERSASSEAANWKTTWERIYSPLQHGQLRMRLWIERTKTL